MPEKHLGASALSLKFSKMKTKRTNMTTLNSPERERKVGVSPINNNTIYFEDYESGSSKPNFSNLRSTGLELSTFKRKRGSIQSYLNGPLVA